MINKIYEKIKEYDKIVIARHIGADPDALGSSIGLKEIIENTFKKKKVSVIGVYSSKFKYMGKLDKLEEKDIKDSLLIVCDTPNLERIDGVDDITKFKEVIKIDHHPEIDKFGSISWIDDNKSSVCEMICDLTKKTNLKMTKSAAEKLFLGIVSDTGRFMYSSTDINTFKVVMELLKEFDIDFPSLYFDLYSRDLDEVRFEGYIKEHITVTKNGLAYIKITDRILNKFNVDSSSSGNIVSSLNNINEIKAWVFFTEDIKQGVIKVNVRSRGPEINKVLEKYNGGGHKYASGARIKDKKNINKIIKDLDLVCENYKD